MPWPSQEGMALTLTLALAGMPRKCSVDKGLDPRAWFSFFVLFSLYGFRGLGKLAYFMVAAPYTREHQYSLHLGDTQEWLTLKSSTGMQEAWVVGYREEGRPLSAEDPRGPEVGLLSASGTFALGYN